MQGLISFLITILACGFILWLLVSKSKETPPVWSSLPSENFVYGRQATKEDCESGKAAFITDETVFIPKLDIVIPQYAYFLARTFAYSKKKTPVIIIQAEQSSEITLVGFMNLVTGKLDGAPIQDIYLLGTTPPEKVVLHD